MERPTVRAAWDDYRRAVLDPIGASATQVQETRRAFYAGAWVLLLACVEIGAPDVSEEEGVECLDAFRAEIEEFARLVGSAF